MAVVALDLSQPARKMNDIARAFRAEENGKTLKKELVKEIRSALQPVRQEVRQSIKAMPSKGVRKSGRSIRSAIAQRITVSVRPTGRAVGARITAGRIKLRGFRHAPKRINTGEWAHPIFGKGSTDQKGKPYWFDGPPREHKDDYRRGCVKAMDKVASSIAGKV